MLGVSLEDNEDDSNLNKENFSEMLQFQKQLDKEKNGSVWPGMRKRKSIFLDRETETRNPKSC